MQVGITVEQVGDEPGAWNDERYWRVKFQGKSYKLFTPAKPIIGSYYPCEVVETQGTYKGKAVVYRDARPVPNPTTHPQQFTAPQQPAPQQQPLPTPTQPAKPCLSGVQRIIEAILRKFPDEVRKDEPNSLNAISTVICTTIIAYSDGRIILDDDLVPDEIRQAYEQVAGENWQDA